MENTSTSVTTSSVGLRYGLLAGLVTIIISFVLNVTNLEQSPARWLSLVVLIAGIGLAHKYFKQHSGGFMSYGQGLGIGAIVSAVTGLLNGIFSYVYVNFIDTEFIARSLDRARADMEARGNMPEEQIEQGVAMAAKFMNGPMLLVAAIFGTLLIGFLLSLVIAAVTKHNRPEFE